MRNFYSILALQVTVLIFATMALPGQSFGFSCAQPPLDELFTTSDAVFLGRVTDVSKSKVEKSPSGTFPVVTTTIKPIRFWKGKETSSLSVRDRYMPGYTSPTLKKGSLFLIFARSENGALYTSMCNSFGPFPPQYHYLVNMITTHGVGTKVLRNLSSGEKHYDDQSKRPTQLRDGSHNLE